MRFVLVNIPCPECGGALEDIRQIATEGPVISLRATCFACELVIRILATLEELSDLADGVPVPLTPTVPDPEAVAMDTYVM